MTAEQKMNIKIQKLELLNFVSLVFNNIKA